MAIEQPTLGLDFTTTNVDVLRGRREPSSVLTPDLAGRVHAVTRDFSEETLVASLVAHSPEKRHTIINDLNALLGRSRYVYFSADSIREPDEDFLARTYAGIAQLERRIEIVEQLPPSPEPWQLFMDRIAPQEKRALMAALGHTLRGRRFHAWQGLESERTVGDFKTN